MQSFIMNSHEVFIHIHQGCFAGIGAIVRLPQCQWSKPDGYGEISQCITTTKHSKAKTVCIYISWDILYASVWNSIANHKELYLLGELCQYCGCWFTCLFLRWDISNGAWWRYQVQNISALLAFCAGNSPVTGELPTQRPVMRRIDVFVDLRLNKRLIKK